MSTDTTPSADQADPAQLLDEVLANSHPLMVEGFFLAATPYWYDLPLFAAMRQRPDNRDEGIIERLSQYSFIIRLEGGGAYTVHPVQRALLNERWIARDPAAYREAHRRALTYWEAHPEPDPDAHARNLLYHGLFVDAAGATETLIGLFRAYSADRQLVTIERILASAAEARRYLLLLGDALPAGFDDLLVHLGTRLEQLRGHWEESLAPLEQLRARSDLSPRLLPYVIRAHGDALAHTGDYVGAIKDYETALGLFDRQAREGANPDNIEAERGYTLVALGDATIGLARAARGRAEDVQVRSSDSVPRSAIRFVLAAPLAIYLSRRLGRQVWHPRYWGLVADLDWIIARLIATAAAYYRQADPILEAHGRPVEAVLADQKLAALYLELGDYQQAEALFGALLDAGAAPIGDYARGTALLGLGGALLAQDRPAEALPRLEAAAPLLHRFEDAAGETQAELAQADALRDLGRPADALPHYEAALRWYNQQEDHVGATLVGERLDALAGDERLPAEARAAAAQSSGAIAPRHYPVRYRHPAIVQFQRAMLVLLTLVIFLTPILAIHLETSTAFEPDISFSAGPLLDNRADFAPGLSQTVQTLKLADPPEPRVLWQAAALLAMLYLALSAVLGLLTIIRTPLSSVQAATYADVVRLDDKSIRTGEGDSRREVAWTDVQEVVRANTTLWRDLVRNDSQAAVAAAEARVVISGQTAWYEPLLARIDRLTPAQAARTDVSFSVLRSSMGALYVLTLVLLMVISIMSLLNKELLFANLPGTPYSLADLYPYFYLGLFLPPMAWFVIQPLRQRRHIDPTDLRLALIVGGIGLLLAVVRVITRFRPWLTVPDIYPALAAILMVGCAAITLLRAPRVKGVPAAAIRGLVGVIAALVIIVMGAQLWRETVSYHYLVRANDLRDKALSPALQTYPDARNATLQQAAQSYERARTIADATLLGIRGRAVLRGGPGLPPDARLTWFDAENSYAAMLSELGHRPDEILAYYDALLAETRDPNAYTGRALAALRAGTLSAVEAQKAGSKLDSAAYLDAIGGLSEAIKQQPDNARYYLWRGFALHALGSTDLAAADYERALAVTTEEGKLSPTDRATALTGLGWADFSRRLQAVGDADRKRLAQSAEERFQQAVKGDPTSPDAWLGLGYARYSLRHYYLALSAWQQAQKLRPDDPAVQLSLGALYWRMGTLLDGFVDENGKDKGGKEYCRRQFTLEQRTAAEQRLGKAVAYWTHALSLPGLDDKAKARTYSSMGQIYYLMQECPNLDAVQMLEKGVAADDTARALDPANGEWPSRGGRLGHNLFQVLRDRSAQPDLAAAGWALRGLQDLDHAIALSTTPDNLRTWRGYKRDRLRETRAYARVGLLAGQGALAAGDVDRATQWYDTSFSLATRAEIGPLDMWGELSALGDWLAAHPEPAADQLRQVRQVIIGSEQRQKPFLQGLSALEAGRSAEATEAFRMGTEDALARGDLAAISAAAVALRGESGRDIASLQNLLQVALPRVEKAARGESLASSVDAAIRTGVLAAALEDYSTAGWWFDEATRRVAKDSSQYYSTFVPAREYLKALWAAEGVRSDALLAAMDRQLDAFLAQAPEMKDNGLFWRYRAWLKYHLGMSAFRLNDEVAARALLDAALADAARARQVAANNQYVFTYLPESAWGWYHIERGDDAVARGDLPAALADYQFAFNLIRPKENSDARNEKATAAFRAGYAALQLSQPERATQWYQQGVALAAQYELKKTLDEEITKLRTWVAETADPTLAATGQEILSSAQAASDRLVKP